MAQVPNPEQTVTGSWWDQQTSAMGWRVTPLYCQLGDAKEWG